MKQLREKLFNSTYLNSTLIDVAVRIARASLEISETLKKGAIVKANMSKNGTFNSHGESVSQLDILANNSVFSHLISCKKIKSVISEENFHEVELNECGRYKVAIDPLDGSSNIPMNIPVGTIFAIYDTISDKIKGSDIIASGYIAYGTSTILVISDGYAAHEFTFCPSLQEYVVTESNLRIPENGTTYSINDALINDCAPGVKKYVEDLRNQSGARARYVGSLVSDFHRNIKSGGLFMYPSTNAHPEGKLRLLYEVMPLTFIIKACRGKASAGEKNPLELATRNIHEKSPIYIGSENMVTKLCSIIRSESQKIRTA